LIVDAADRRLHAAEVSGGLALVPEHVEDHVAGEHDVGQLVDDALLQGQPLFGEKVNGHHVGVNLGCVQHGQYVALSRGRFISRYPYPLSEKKLLTPSFTERLPIQRYGFAPLPTLLARRRISDGGWRCLAPSCVD